MNNKEFGSDFYTVFNNYLPNNKVVFPEDSLFAFSGRTALYSVLQHGISYYNWKRFYVPSYYCHEVYDFIKGLDIEIIQYQCLPCTAEFDIDSVDDASDSAILVVDYFGINKIEINNLKNVIVIEDLTHNLKSCFLSTADYTFGSLRKVLPIGVGGFLFSNKGNDLPILGSTLFAEEVAYKKMSGMYLKKLYLEGISKIEKSVFRELLVSAEECFDKVETISSLPKVVKCELENLDVDKIISIKKNNIKYAKSLLIKNNKYSLFTSDNGNDFALILLFGEPKERDSLKSFLVQKSIYPMILWPNQVKENLDFQDRILFIHMDFRYSDADVKYIVNQINSFCSNV